MPDLLPEEWRTAAETLSAMNRVAGPLSRSYPRSLVAFVVPFACGAAPASLFMPSLAASADATVPMSIMAGILAFGGLLVGFVVTLMLFTGRLENPSRLSFEQAEAYVGRIKYLLASQAMTLFAALMLSLLAVVWMVLFAMKVAPASMVVVGIVLCGFGGVCLMRMFLLPMQIFELHEEALDDAIERAAEETNQRFRAH